MKGKGLNIYVPLDLYLKKLNLMTKKKTTKKKHVMLECPHAHESPDGYLYDITDEVSLDLCPNCNMNLAGEIMKQLAIESFILSMQKREDEE